MENVKKHPKRVIHLLAKFGKNSRDSVSSTLNGSDSVFAVSRPEIAQISLVIGGRSI